MKSVQAKTLCWSQKGKPVQKLRGFGEIKIKQSDSTISNSENFLVYILHLENVFSLQRKFIRRYEVEEVFNILYNFYDSGFDDWASDFSYNIVPVSRNQIVSCFTCNGKY